MASYPDDVRYTDTHEWVRPRDKFYTVGITELAAEKLGDVSFVELPYPGELFKPGDPLGRLSGATSSTAFKLPFVCQVNAVNKVLEDTPSLINSDPFGDGWIVRIESGGPEALDDLMDAEQYAAFVSSSAE